MSADAWVEGYGSDVEILNASEARNDISTPIPRKSNAKSGTKLHWQGTYKAFIENAPSRRESIRNVVLCGCASHGKTALLDLLLREADMPGDWGKTLGRNLRERKTASYLRPASILLKSRDESLVCNVADAQGHADMYDDVLAGLHLADGAILCVDAVEGIGEYIRRLLHDAVICGLSLLLVITKVDRLILELKLPPEDAYHKLRNIIDEVNSCISETLRSESFIAGNSERSLLLSPGRGNVLFTSAPLCSLFSTHSFAKIYAKRFGGLDTRALAKRLWGDICFDSDAGHFIPLKNSVSKVGISSLENGMLPKRTFVEFILEPLYKVCSVALSAQEEDISRVCEVLRLERDLCADPSRSGVSRAAEICRAFLGSPCAPFGEAVLSNISSPARNARTKHLQLRNWTTKLNADGGVDEAIGSLCIDECDACGPVVVLVAASMVLPKSREGKYASPPEVLTICRVLSGRLCLHACMTVIGSLPVLHEDEIDDKGIRNAKTVLKRIYTLRARELVPLKEGYVVCAGNWFIAAGVDVVAGPIMMLEEMNSSIGQLCSKLVTRRQICFENLIVRVSVESARVDDIPHLVRALRHVQEIFRGCRISPEGQGTGVFILRCRGEMYLDRLLQYLRAFVDVNVSDPSVDFRETVIGKSPFPCAATAGDASFRISILASTIDQKRCDSPPLAKPQHMYLMEESLINVNVDHRRWILDGFSYAVQAGPLCDEQMMGVNFSVSSVESFGSPVDSNIVTATARRATYCAFLLASPRMLEPILVGEALCPQSSLDLVRKTLFLRRGRVSAEIPVQGSPFFRVIFSLPGIESFGFETQVKLASEGLISITLRFYRWDIVPGDPLDDSVNLPPLEKASTTALGKDVMIKVRRRNALRDNPQLEKYFDDALLNELHNAIVAGGQGEVGKGPLCS